MMTSRASVRYATRLASLTLEIDRLAVIGG
jgi:hypothetical protein